MFASSSTSNMSAIVCAVCFSAFLSSGAALFDSVLPSRLEPPSRFPNVTDEATPILNSTDPESANLLKLFQAVKTISNYKAPIIFPNKSDESTPILIGEDPKSVHLPPKHFPTRVLEITTQVLNRAESTVSVNTPKTTGEANDMLHSKYTGGEDVDEVWKPQKKATKEEKKPSSPKNDPKNEVAVSAGLDKDGPKLMNSSSGPSMLESTSKVIAESSSVLSQQTTHERHRVILEPARAVASTLLSAAAVLCFAVIGLLFWKRIATRKFGRDILINEEDFDDTSDLHAFDRTRIQIS